MLQAAVQSCFDFSNVGPYYYTRLNLALRSLHRLNYARVAEQAATQCLLCRIFADEETGTVNFKNHLKNSRLVRKLLNLTVPDEVEDSTAELIQEWRRRQAQQQVDE